MANTVLSWKVVVEILNTKTLRFHDFHWRTRKHQLPLYLSLFRSWFSSEFSAVLIYISLPQLREQFSQRGGQQWPTHTSSTCPEVHLQEGCQQHPWSLLEAFLGPGSVLLPHVPQTNSAGELLAPLGQCLTDEGWEFVKTPELPYLHTGDNSEGVSVLSLQAEGG